MSTTKKKLSESKLASSKEYREEFVSAFLKRYIPFQVRTIRKKRRMSQPELAIASQITQGVISRAEDPNYGNLTFNTVLRIAAGFDLAFVGKFVPFSELLKVIDEMSEESLNLPGFVEECNQEDAAITKKDDKTEAEAEPKPKSPVLSNALHLVDPTQVEHQGAAVYSMPNGNENLGCPTQTKPMGSATDEARVLTGVA